MMWKIDGKWCCRTRLSHQEVILHHLGFFFAFLLILPHLLLEERVFLPVKIFVPKEVTLVCTPAQCWTSGFSFAEALLQLAGENHSKTISYGPLYDPYYLDFKCQHLQTPCLWEKNISQWFPLTRKLLSPATLHAFFYRCDAFTDVPRKGQ